MKKILLTLAAAVLTLSLGIAQDNNRPQKQKNIIFVLTDDQRWDALGYQGNNIIQTPNMDKLASEGIYFKNAFVTTPICATSRASIITGLYERKHGYTFGQPPVSQQRMDSSYFALLKNAGYYNGFMGKLGVRMENRLDTALFDYYKPTYANFYWRLRENKHVHLTDIMGQQAVDFIRNAPEEKPFCLSVSFNAPHAEDSSPDQYIWPKDLDSLYNNIIIPDPIMAEDARFNEQPEYVQNGFNRVRWYWRYDSPDKYQRMVKGYYRMITAIDRTIGKIREELERKGIADNTVIMVMGDNGYFLGERQFAGKWLMYEPSLRVPLIIYEPGNKHRDIEDMVLNIDVTPTILDFANVDIPDSYQGISLVDYTKKKKNGKGVRKSFICEHLWDFEWIPASEGIRTKNYKYFRYVDDPGHEELYNLKKDPMEQENLAGNKKHEDKLAELRKRFEVEAAAIR